MSAAPIAGMRCSWPHSGFSTDQSVFLPAGDRLGIERLVGYMTRCPFSLSRLVKVAANGQVVYKAEKDDCRAFPEPQGDGLASGPKRNFQVLAPLDFLAEFTQHIPPKGSHLIRYYGYYSNKARGMRKKAAAEAADASSSGAAPGAPALSRCSQTWAMQTWAMLIKRVYEFNPLACPECGGTMKVIAFLEPPQADVIEKILRHCGLWHASSPRAPPADGKPVHDPDGVGGAVHDPDGVWDSPWASDEPEELTFVDEDTFWATF